MDTNEQWQQLARELGFTFTKGVEGIFESPHLEKIMRASMPMKGKDIQQARDFINMPLVKALINKIFLSRAR